MDIKDRDAGLGTNYFLNRGQISLVDMLFRKIKPNKPLSILSLGCGDGHELKSLVKYGDVDIVDIDDKAIGLIPKNRYSSAFISNINEFQTKKHYDVVVALELLEHLEDDKKAVDKVHDLLKPGGFFIFTVPAHQGLFSAHDKFLNHVRRYDRKDLTALVNSRFHMIFLTYRYSSLILPGVISKLINKKAPPKSEALKIPDILNAMLFSLLRMEIFLMDKGMSLPIGLSFAGVCRK